MSDDDAFESVAARYRAMTVAMEELRAEVKRLALERYKAGVSVTILTDACGIARPTLYQWIAHPNDPPRKKGRPKGGRNTDLPTEIEISPDIEIGWFEDRVRVDRAGKRVIIDTERIEFEGDRSLGQLLVSGTDTELIGKFNNFISKGKK